MRILAFHSFSRIFNEEFAGGADRVFIEITNRLADAGHSVTLIRADNHSLSPISYYSKGILHIFFNRYDALFSNNTFYPLLVPKNVGVSSIHLVNTPPLEKVSPLRAQIISSGLGRTDIVFAHSKFIMNELAKRGYFKSFRGRMILLYPGVDTNIYKPISTSQRQYVLFVGALIKGKGLETLLDAMEIIHTYGYKIPFHLVLDTSSWGSSDPFYLRGILKRINAHIKKSHQLTYSFRLPRMKLVEVYSKAKVFVNPVWPSILQPFAMVNIEAQACGVPVVTSNCGGLHETINEGITGLLIKPMDPQALAHAILRFYDGELDAEVMGRMAREKVKEDFKWDRTINRIVNALESKS